jgi:nicotinamidase-related amidase
VLKHEDDGSDELMEYISKDTHVYVCGMNTDACVSQTVLGLKKKGYEVTVVGDACWTVYASKSAKHHQRALSKLRGNGIRVIKTSAVR